MNAKSLKKNAFWLLFGAVPLLVGIGVILIGATVGNATSKRQEEYDNSQKEITGAKPKGVGIGVELSKQKGQLDTKVTALWADNFKQQKDTGLYAWPTTPRPNGDLAVLEKLNAPFGDDFRKPAEGGDAPATGPALSFLDADQSALIEFAAANVYLKAYETAAKNVYPTRFGSGGPLATGGGPGVPGEGGSGGGRPGFPGSGSPGVGVPGGPGPGIPGVGVPGGPGPGIPGGGLQNNAGAGWQAVLRHVTDWGSTGKPTVPEFWLALEDFWVQREMLSIVARTNTALTKFEPEFSFWNYTPLKRTFVSRLWAIDLEVVTEGNRKYLKSTVRNQTDRLQMLGMGKVMRLKVWLDNPTDADPSLREYVIGGELVVGHGVMDVPLMKTDPRDKRKEGPHAIPLERPVTRISKIEQILDEVNVPVKLIQAIELGVTDHRRTAATFVAPKLKGLPEDPPADANATPGGEPGGPPGMPPGGGRDGGGPGIPGMPGVGGATAGAKTGPKEFVLLGNKLRYLEVTDQVRRMPVALSLVLDQAFVQDLLVQFTNSPMRFHVSQANWQRFRGTLPASTPTTGGPGSGVPGTGVPGTGIPGVGGPGGGDGGEGGYPGGFGGTSSAAVTAQANAGLVTLSVYGAVSMYNELPLFELKVTDDEKLAGLGTDWKTPKKVSNDAELLALVPDEAARVNVLRSLDLRTHDLVAFSWEGPAGDKLTFTVVEGSIKFGLAPGAKKEEQPPVTHRKLYAIRRTAKWTAE